MGTHGYHRIERERRFLLAGLPSPLTPTSFHRVCTDRYLDGLRLRVRSLIASDGSEAEYKLGQKHHPAGLGADEREMTTFYLTAEEHGFLVERLGGALLLKRRYPFDHEGVRYSIDVFEGRCSGLVLADLELADPDRLRAIRLPPFAVREVTDDPRFEGGTLAKNGLPD